MNGSPERSWAVRRPDGTFERWSEEMGFLWGAKDELPATGLVCVGKHLARAVACVAPRLVPVLVAANGAEPEGTALQVAETVRDAGPLTGPELREATGLPKKDIDKAVVALHHGVVLTSSHLVEQDGPWGALAHDLVERKWPLPERLPARETHGANWRSVVLDRAVELTAADLAGALGWRRKEAAAVLEEVGDGHDEEGFRIWKRR